MRRFHSLRFLQTVYGVSFLILLVIAASVGGVGLSVSREISEDAQRLGRLMQTIEQIRGDLYRQTKELFDYHFLSDPDAGAQYRDYSRQIDSSLAELHNMAINQPEKESIAKLTNAYRHFREFADWLMTTEPAAYAQEPDVEVAPPNESSQLIWFDLELEGDRLTALETAFEESQKLVLSAQSGLEARLGRLLRVAVLLLAIPLGIAAALLLFARDYLNRAFVQPLSAVLDAMPALGKGDLQRRLKEEGALEMNSLQHSINDMAAALAQSREALVQSETNAARGALVPVIAHNIRNPLASIRAVAQVTEGSPGVTAEIKNGLKDVQGAVDRLENWLSALLNYLNPSPPNFENNDIVESVDHALVLLRPAIERKNITIAFDGRENRRTFLFDAHLVEQAIYGLLTNAVEAAPPNSSVGLTLRYSEDEAQLEISDHGSGLPFEPSPSMGLNPGPTTKTFGSGLGIPFAYKISELHGGRLDFERLQNRTTRVSFVLPAASRPRPA